jgi:hypothetical protein
MDQFAHLPAEERAIVFREAAARLGLGAVTVVEKDFWVCWTLKRIFSCAALPWAPLQGWNLAIQGLQSHRAFL